MPNLYKLITSNLTILVSSSTSLVHLNKRSKLSWETFLMCFKRGFITIPINWLSFLVVRLGSCTIGFSFTSFFSKISMNSVFIAHSINSDFWILDSLWGYQRPNKQESYIKYRTFYQNDYEAKAIEQTVTYLVLGLEESNIDINNHSARKQQEWIKRNCRYTGRYCNLDDSPSIEHRNCPWNTR